MIIQSSQQALAASFKRARRRPRCQCYATAASGAVNSRDPYAVLGLDRSAQGEDIKNAYYGLVKEYHPDRGGQNTPESRETFSMIMDAYSLLRNPSSRAAYLQSGIGWEHGSGGSSAARESRARASTTADAGFHTGRRRAFDERQAQAGSKEVYERWKAAQEIHFKSRYRWDPDYKGSKPGMSAKDLDGIWTPYNAREADNTGRPVATFVAFIVLAIVVIINKPRKYYAPNAGTEAYARSETAKMAKRIREAEAANRPL